MTGVIRALEPGDIDEIVRIEKECFSSEAWPKEDFEALADCGGDIQTTLVYDLGGRVCGYISGTSLLGELEIYSVAVEHASRRRGIATALIKELEKLSMPEREFLEVRRSNAPAIALYRSLGFMEYGLRRGYYTDPLEDAVTMKKENACGAT